MTYCQRARKTHARSQSRAILLGHILLATVLCVGLTACSSEEKRHTLRSEDVAALRRIYSVSSWVFHPTRLSLQVFGDGGLELAIDGETTYKTDGRDDHYKLIK